MDTPSSIPDERTSATRHGVARWLYKQAVFLAMLAVMLFWLAGRWNWWRGWLQVGLYVVVVAAQALILIPRSPGLIAERSGYQKGSQVLDTVVASLAAALFPMAAWVLAGLDARYGWSVPMATLWTAAAAVVWLLGYALLIWAMAANAFFGATVRIQEERGHHVETGGPYRYVRHPGYVGAILFQLATPWLLGSWWALLPSVLSAACYVVRTALEDRTLQCELDGYREYTRQTRYRLLPGIW